MSRDTSTNDVFSSKRVLPNTREECDAFVMTIVGELQSLGYDETARFAIRLALEEALANALVHGNAGRPERRIIIRYRLDRGAAGFEINDEGPGFDPDSVPNPIEDENLEIPSGRGIMLMRAYMTEVEVIPPGNCVRMWYHRDDRDA